jgi:E3 ubiquitin-protein ligase UHRF1
MCDTEEGLYKVGEKVDAKDLRMGAWFEAQVVKVTVKNCDATEGATSATEQVLQYHVKYDDYDDDEPVVLSVDDVRPRACTRVQFSQLSVGSMVMVNYNHDHPSQRGYWYDALITLKSDSPRKVRGKIILDSQHLEIAEECPIKFMDDIFAIPKKLSPDEETNEGEMRIKKPDCDYCKDNMSRQCKYCACSVCGGKHEPDKQLLCDECDSAFHIWCLDPPLDVIPDTDEWYCSECKTDTSEVIGAGEKLRLSKKKANMQSKKGDTTRDWGKGMACVGRTKTCTIVPSNHFGPIPGIPVGTMWKFRVQVSACVITIDANTLIYLGDYTSDANLVY